MGSSTGGSTGSTGSATSGSSGQGSSGSTSWNSGSWTGAVVDEQPQLDLCSVCDFVAAAEDLMEGDNATEEWVISELEGLCNLTGSLASECDLVIELYAVPILNELDEGTPADQVCAQVGACSASSGSGSTGSATGGSGSTGAAVNFRGPLVNRRR